MTFGDGVCTKCGAVGPVSPHLSMCLDCVGRWLANDPRSMRVIERLTERLTQPEVLGPDRGRYAMTPVALAILFAFLDRCRK